jgi:hypothetical protein
MIQLKDKRFTFVAAIWFAIAVVDPHRSVLAQTPLAAPSVDKEPQTKISSEADLAKLVAQLEQPSTRLSAISTLDQGVRLKLYRVGSVYSLDRNATINALQNKAVEAVLKYTDFETVSQALDSPDRDLQFWGVRFWRKGAFKARDSQPNVWLSLIPRIKDLAAKDDTHIRLSALQALRGQDDTKSFLAERLKAETDSFNVLNLLEHYDKVELSKQFMPYLLRFLNAEDKEVRCQALFFIGSNHYSAPMWQVTFDKSVADRVLEMTKSADEEERKTALFALEGMNKKPTQN